MSVKLQSKASFKPRQEPLIMRVLRFGRINPMIKDLTFGHWVV